MAQHRPLSPKSGVHVDHNANDEEPLIQITTPPTDLQGQLASRQENVQEFLTDHDGLPYTSPTFPQTPSRTRTWAEEQTDAALQQDQYDNLSGVDWTAFDIQDLLPFLPYLFGGNEYPYPQDGYNNQHSSPQSPICPPAAGLISGGNRHWQPGQAPLSLLIPNPSSAVAGPPTGTSSTTTPGPSAQSPGPSAAGTHAAAEDIRNVGSTRIRQASASRRKKDGIHQCPFDDCDSTFTELHNLQYHMNSHQDLRPYECTFTECSYAAASPTTLRKHMNKLHQ